MSQHNIIEALNVRVEGTGARILVLAHGFGTDQSAWHLILPYFTPTYTVVLYDLVCAGSVNPDYFDFNRYTTLDPYVDDLLNIIDSLGIQNCAYVGHSVSAMIGIIASIRRPELFSKLILIGASPRFLNDEEYHGGFEEGEIEKVFSAMEANYEAWVHGYAPLAVGADVPDAVREFSRTLFNMRPDISLFVSRTVFNSDLRGVLGLVRVPSCVIQTAKDVSVPASVAEYLRTHLGGDTTVETLKSEGHLPHLSDPVRLVQCLRRALPRTRIFYHHIETAVEVMAKVLSKELKGTEITVNCVSPGPVATEMFFAGLSDEIVEKVKSQHAFGRLGETKDIAHVVGFLASDANGGSLL